MTQCSWCSDIPGPPYYLSRESIVRHKLAWEYRNGWRNTDSPRHPNDDDDVVAATGEEPDTPTHDTDIMDVDPGEDEADFPRVSKFTFKLQCLRKIRPVDFTSVTESEKELSLLSSYANGWTPALHVSNTVNYEISFGNFEELNCLTPAGGTRSFDDLLDSHLG